MITPDELLDFAAFDLTSIQSEAAVRRAMSAAYYAAYYAVFHAIAHAGAARFRGSETLQQRIARSYDHGAVRTMAGEVGRRSGDPGFVIVAGHLHALREARETADYDLLADLTWKEGLDAISRAVEALLCIARLKDDPEFAELLLLPLLRDRARRG